MILQAAPRITFDRFDRQERLPHMLFLRPVSHMLQLATPANLRRTLLSCTLIGLGYILGVTGIFQPQASSAQAPKVLDTEDAEVAITISNDAVKQIKLISESLAAAMETLRLESQYTAATETLNPYLILTGGGNAIDDLERGTGVDPFTFADLYAGNAVREVADELTRDDQGRLLYKNTLVRIYSVERLKRRQEMSRAILEKRVLP